MRILICRNDMYLLFEIKSLSILQFLIWLIAFDGIVFFIYIAICWSHKKYVSIENTCRWNYCMFWCPRNQNIYRCNILINANILLNSLFRREHVFCFKTVLLIVVKTVFKNGTHVFITQDFFQLADKNSITPNKGFE